MEIELLTPGESGKILDLTPDGVKAIERRGGLVAIKTSSGRRLFLKGDIEKLREQRAKKMKKESGAAR